MPRNIKTVRADYKRLVGKNAPSKATVADLEEAINAARATKPGRKPTPFTEAVRAKGKNPRVIRAKLRAQGLHGPYDLSNKTVRAAVNA